MPVELDLHPDDLLHRARVHRPLSRDEELYLEAHLRDCATCRFVRDAGRAFDGEAAEGPPIQMEAIIDRTMHALRAHAARARRPMPRRLAAGAVAVVAMVGGVAFAGYWGSRHPLRERATITAPAVAPAPAARRRHAPRSQAGDLPVTAPPPVAPPPVVAAPVVPLPVAAPPVAAPPALMPPVASSTVDRSPPGAAARGPSAPARRIALVRTPADADADTPARLFETANRERRQGDAAAAEAAYAALWTRFRGSREALASRAIAGQWTLDRGQPRAAIALFHQYLAAAPTGDLEEDVLVGLADAHDRLGDAASAIAAWRRLLSEHPASVHAARARAGLRRLQRGAVP